MESLRRCQQSFARAVMEGRGDFESEIAEQGAVSAHDRLRIYQNAYGQRLRECVQIDHETLAAYLGDDMFEQMVGGYIEAYPSRSPSLREYCRFLPAFLAKTPPFCDYPVIADLARFERSLLQVFDAADGNRKSELELAVIPAAEWSRLRFTLHPSVSVFSSDWNVVQIWQAMKAETAPQSPDRQTPAHWLLWRDRTLMTSYRSMQPAEAAAIQSLRAGESFAEVCDKLADLIDESLVSQTLSQWLRHWLDDGLISDFSF